jgi:hypothetical protein
MGKLDGFLNESKAAYCGLLIVDNKQLLKLVDNLDNDWERLAHHMTIKMGELPEELKDKKGNVFVDLTATHIGYFEDKVVAVKLDSKFKSQNAFSHVTLAVNRKNGGKPFLSNKITEWKKLDKPISLEGKLSEFASDGKIV